MSDNKEFWKEILGDAYDEDIVAELDSAADEPAASVLPPVEEEAEPAPAAEEPPRVYAPPAVTPEPETYEQEPPEQAREITEIPPAFDNDDVKIYGGEKAEPTELFEAPAKESRRLFKKEKNKGGEPERDGDRGPDDFEVDFDFDSEYRDLPEDKPIKRRREKRTGCVGGILYAAFIICISVLLAVFGWLAATDVLGFGDADMMVEVTIPDDYTIDQVADILKENGLIKYGFLFKFYANFSSADEKIVGGTYNLNVNYDYRAIVNGMTESGGMLVETDNITIPEGYTLKQIFELLEANKVCSAEKLWDTAANYDFDYDFLEPSTLGNKLRLEGFLFPDTYKFYVNDDPEDVIDKMLDNFDTRFTDEYAERAAELGYSVRDIVSIASMIEREAGSDDERSGVSSVIHNRLNSEYHRLLQLDSTINYVIGMTGENFSTEIDSPYNTYQHEGLPEGPIANPGLPSIKAALYPDDTDYYYFGLDVNGNTRFFENHDDFIAFINSDEYSDD